MFNYKIKKTYLVVAFILVEAFAVYIWNGEFKDNLGEYHEEKIHEIFSAYDVTQNTFRLVAETYYDQVVNKENVASILNQIGNDEIRNAELRKELQYDLSHAYKSLKYRGLKRLNFYLPNNKTFLQFHNPNEFGQKASTQRASIYRVNRLKKFQMGFEESRYFNGFRFVFPLFGEKRKYLGCVEISVGFNTIRTEMMKVKRINYGFAIKKSVVGAAAYRDFNSNYLKSNLSAKYLFETTIFNNAQRIYADQINFELRKKLTGILQIVAYEEISTGKAYARSIPNKGVYYTATLMPIKNISGKNIGYILGFSRDKKFKLFEVKFHLQVAGTTMALILIIGFIYFENRNIRHIRLQNKDMKEKAWELHKSNATKEKFLNFVAEDLNNPFHFIKGYSKALQEEGKNLSDEDKNEYLTIINQAAENGHHLIENLLEWSRIQKADAEYEPEQHYLSDIVNDIMESHFHLAESKKLSMYSEVTKKETNKVFADKGNVSNIIRNLVSNAIKFTPEGGRVKVYSQNDGNFLQVSVEDNGVGIKSETLRSLFATGKDTEKDDGKTSAKLGLILTKELVERNGGKLKIDSQSGRGSKFTFTLPINKQNKLFKTLQQ